ncbi:deleted in malignant brain tumors 1 protein-like [Saccostrea cucullata]|uniref:deleted in malignant brain tumors 1 protein-like n=1 Tax=Saccostrea cuccullata TaxID=36930 RepID=UPI002ED3B93A
MAQEEWTPLAKKYCPLMAGSIDKTDTEPHDHGIIRALSSSYKPNKDVAGDPHCTVFVSRLNPKTDEETLESELSYFGGINKIRLVRDVVTGHSRCYAFVEFKEERSAVRAERDGHMMEIDGHEILVDFELERTLPGWIPRRMGGVELCPDGQSFVNCFVAPCDVSTCPAFPTAICKDDYCGGCNAVWSLNDTDVTSDCQKKSAEVRLIHGNNINHGMVEVWQENQWKLLCAWPQFFARDALVICKQLGFSQGTVLPMAAYGRQMGNYSHPFKGCSNGENRIQDCQFDKNYTPNVCATQDVHYGSVSCYDKLKEGGIQLSPLHKDSKDSQLNSGKVEIFQQQVFGQVCSTYFAEEEANVTCRQLGFLGGVPMTHEAEDTLPFLLTGLHCHGNESKLSECYQELQICYTDQRAGVLCYNSSGVGFSLAESKTSSGGIAVISVDGSGQGWLLTGISYSGKSSELARDVYLSSVSCLGVENSVIACKGSGWRNVNRTYCNHDNDAGVYCYKSVRLSYGYQRDNATLGIVEVFQKYYWTTLCADRFDQKDADVVCRQLGYSRARVLLPGLFGRSGRYVYTISINCTGNETDILQCEHDTGYCSSDNYASLLCTHEDTNPQLSVNIEHSDNGRVMVSQFDVKGTVCRNGWENMAAMVLCREHGFKGGVVYSSSDELARYQPIWIGSVKCSGQEKRIVDCVFNYSVSPECGYDRSSAGVLCYNSTGMKIRLAGGYNANQGRVEISRDSVWGTICHNRWSTSDADVVCRQLHYASGTSYRDSYHGAGTGPVLMDRVSCFGSENSIFECANLGWNQSADACKDHSQDAGVYCMPWVKLSQHNYGTVLAWKKNNYGPVCADGFDENAARVVCNELQYSYSIKFCCSGLGPEPKDLDLAMSDVHCDGTESGLRQCKNEYINPSCSDKNYAAVYCTNTNPAQSTLSVHVGQSNIVEVTYVYQPGLLSAADFTDKDASVICRENGFLSGKALRHLRPKHKDLFWLRNVSCLGNENKFNECPNAGKIGDLGRFDDSIAAAVACSNANEPPKTQLRLSYGSKLSEGHVQLNLNGVWGSLCAGNLTDAEAKVICKLSGYRDGVALPGGSFGQNYPRGTPLMDYLNCTGDEKRLIDCVVSLSSSQSLCPLQTMSAVKCYETVRLTGSSRVDYGRLELWNDDGWYSVCDENFDDQDATVVCKALGFTLGKAQCCSAVGNNGTVNPILFSNFSCTGNEFNPFSCTYEKTGRCRSGKYASVLCLQTSTEEDLTIHLESFYGPVVISRYGLSGYVCNKLFDNFDATMICKTKGYQTGYAVNVYKDFTFPIVMGNLTCNGANEINRCTFSKFSDDHGCSDSDTVAGVICSNTDKLLFKLDSQIKTKGIPKLEVGSNTLYLDDTYFDEAAVNLFCLNAGFAGGSRLSQSISLPSVHNIVTDIRCSPNAPRITHCKGNWDPRKSKSIPIFEISCFHQARLENGGTFYGAVELYSSNSWGTVCPESFGQPEADVVCTTLGYKRSLPICCSPFGPIPSKQLFTEFQCSGSEKNILECSHTFQRSGVQCRRNELQYASVLCYNGILTQDYSIKINGGKYFGDVKVSYMGVDGRICRDGWDDNDARVVCRQNNYIRGLAYSHYVEEGKQLIWISNVQCQGHEGSLQECPHSPVGSVTECKSLHYAGVFCFNDQGIYYRISGGDPSGRSGRAEIFFDDNWGTMCSTNWGEEEATALCRQMGFHGGDPIEGPYKVPGKGVVYKSSYQCTDESTSLTDCPHSGWQEVVDGECVDHRNDAGVFCYQNVRIYNSIGRSKSSGPVLLFRQNQWYLLCDDGFTDQGATLVCQELGFPYGYASCCSTDGPLSYPIWMNHTLDCASGTHVEECLQRKTCARKSYASVTCTHLPRPKPDTSPKPDAPLPSKADDNKTVVAVISAIAGFLLFVVIVIIVIKCRQSKKKDTGSDVHGSFREGVLNKSHDGSIHAQNPLHDLYDSADVRIQNDSVQYHNHGEDRNPALAFSNINYNTIHFSPEQTDSDFDTSDDHIVEHKDTKPLGIKSEIEDSSYAVMRPNFSASDLHVYDNQQNKTYHNCVTIENAPEDRPTPHFTRSLSECREIAPPE